MNLSMLDREQLEAIVLDPSGTDGEPHRCCDADPGPVADETTRDRRLRHVLAAAHELLVRIAHKAVVGRRFLNATWRNSHITGSFAPDSSSSWKRSIRASTSFPGARSRHCTALRQNIAAARAAGTGCSITRSRTRSQSGGPSSSAVEAHNVDPVAATTFVTISS